MIYLDVSMRSSLMEWDNSMLLLCKPTSNMFIALKPEV